MTDLERMKAVLDTAGLYSRAKLRFRSGQIDEHELFLIKKAYERAVRKYTDPLGTRTYA